MKEPIQLRSTKGEEELNVNGGKETGSTVIKLRAYDIYQNSNNSHMDRRVGTNIESLSVHHSHPQRC